MRKRYDVDSGSLDWEALRRWMCNYAHAVATLCEGADQKEHLSLRASR
jgi:hypothetical protein